MAVNGSGGIPLDGKTVEYATELWLAGPSAFWLHPEGPLSETTPEEWLAKQPKPDCAQQFDVGLANQYAQYQNQWRVFHGGIANQCPLAQFGIRSIELF